MWLLVCKLAFSQPLKGESRHSGARPALRRWRSGAPGNEDACPCYSRDVAKVTNKLQVTVPKPLAVQLGIRPGDDVDWAISGHSLQVIPTKHRRPSSVNRLRDLDP